MFINKRQHLSKSRHKTGIRPIHLSAGGCLIEETPGFGTNLTFVQKPFVGNRMSSERELANRRKVKWVKANSEDVDIILPLNRFTSTNTRSDKDQNNSS